MLLDPRAKDVNGISGQDEWWAIMHRLWPASYDPSQHGQWGRSATSTTSPGTPARAQASAGASAQACSALALDWLSNKPSPSLGVLAAYGSEGGANHPLSVVPRDKWQTYTMHWVAGRTDGTTPRQGLVEIWENANDTPKLRRAGINTIQKAKASDGKIYVQKWMQLWEGDWTQNLQKASSVSLALTQSGRTFQAALAEGPARFHSNVSGPGVWGKTTRIADYPLSAARFPRRS